jgi:hypothetical protein
MSQSIARTQHTNRMKTSILEQLLQTSRKAQNLVKVLDHFGLRVHPRAEASERQLAWIVEK